MSNIKEGPSFSRRYHVIKITRYLVPSTTSVAEAVQLGTLIEVPYVSYSPWFETKPHKIRS